MRGKTYNVFESGWFAVILEKVAMWYDVIVIKYKSNNFKVHDCNIFPRENISWLNVEVDAISFYNVHSYNEHESKLWNHGVFLINYWNLVTLSKIIIDWSYGSSPLLSNKSLATTDKVFEPRDR